MNLIFCEITEVFFTIFVVKGAGGMGAAGGAASPVALVVQRQHRNS